MRHAIYTNFVIDPAAIEEVSNFNFGEIDAYKNEIWRLVDRINRETTGRIFFEAMQATGKQFQFIPFIRQRGENTNAFASGDNFADQTPVGISGLHCSGDQMGQLVRRFPFEIFETTGTGLGSNVTVTISPSLFLRRNNFVLDSNLMLHHLPGTTAGALERRYAFQGPGAIRDEVLLHELLHGYRAACGLLLCTTENMDAYDTYEEFFAIVLTNMYISEISGDSNTSLRSHHQGFTRLPYAQLFSDDRQNQEWLGQINQQHTDLVRHLAMLTDVPFNPFRELYRSDAIQTSGPMHA